MRYSTFTSIYVMLPGINKTNPNDILIQQHADRISGKINSYVGRCYNVSGWTTAALTPQAIQLWSDALTAQLTMRSKFTSDGQNRNEWVNELAKDALEDLEKVREKDLKIFNSDGTEATLVSGSSSVQSTRKDFTPIFDVDKDINWVVDPDLIDSIADDRL